MKAIKLTEKKIIDSIKETLSITEEEDEPFTRLELTKMISELNSKIEELEDIITDYNIKNKR